jgi:transposase
MVGSLEELSRHSSHAKEGPPCLRVYCTTPSGSKATATFGPSTSAVRSTVGCRTCGAVKQAKVAFAPGRHRYIRRFARYVLDLTRAMTMSDVARHIGVSWNVVKAILKTDLERRFRRPKLKGLRRIAIDEVSIERGHRYLTIVLDLDSGAVIFVGEGRGADALDPFWKRLRRSGARIDAVATDMSQAYIRAVRTHLQDTTLVFDRFHVIKLMND